MRRLLALATSLLVILLAPAAAANPAPPTLTGTDFPAWTELSWSAPPSTSVANWTLHRTSTSGTFDHDFDLGPSTRFLDHIPPPDETFTYYVTYTTTQGEDSDPSNLYVRQFADCDPAPTGGDPNDVDVECAINNYCWGSMLCDDLLEAWAFVRTLIGTCIKQLGGLGCL